MNRGLYYAEIGARIAALRRERGITLTEASATAGRSAATLSKYENGSLAIPCDTLTRLCTFYGAEIAEAFPPCGGTDAVALLSGDFNLWVYWCKGSENTINAARVEGCAALKTAECHLYVRTPEYPDDADFTYTGTMIQSDYSVDFCFRNRSAPFDITTMAFQTQVRRSDKYRYMLGMISGISYAYQNVALKAIATWSHIDEQEFLVRTLKMSPRDLTTLRTTNSFVVE
jgi:DNA-binding Xre family transcriptional regulator